MDVEYYHDISLYNDNFHPYSYSHFETPKVPAAPSSSSSSSASLRKGKWTPEEEAYSNKVIEVFNSGFLDLEETEKGVTLRAYLAKKLQCDPMRITKKYTGASCLGKKVYAINCAKTDPKEIEKARDELQDFEAKFLEKLEEINKKKHSNEKFVIEEEMIVSTPAIDALLNSHRSFNHRSKKPKDPLAAPQLPYCYPYSFMVPPLTGQNMNAEMNSTSVDMNGQIFVPNGINVYPFSRKMETDETDHDSLSHESNSQPEEAPSDQNKPQPSTYVDFPYMTNGGYPFYQFPVPAFAPYPFPNYRVKHPIEYVEREPALLKRSKLSSDNL